MITQKLVVQCKQLNVSCKTWHLLLLVILSAGLLGCGSGGSGRSNNNPQPLSSSSTPASSVIAASSAPASSAQTSSAPASSVSASSVSTQASLKIEAEDYLRFKDATTANEAGAPYRNDAVDIEVAMDTGGGYNIGYINADEWLEFTLVVSNSGTFTAEARVASQQPGGSFTLELGSTPLGNPFTLTPSTGGWQTWTTLTQSIGSISAGTHTLCVQMKQGPFNLNWIQLSSTDGGAVAVSSTPIGEASPCVRVVAPPQVTVPENIKLNQLGFKPNSEKLAVVPAVDATTFSIVTAGTESVVMTGNLTAAATWEPGLDSVKLADFSTLTAAGSYELRVSGVAKAAAFTIAANVYEAVSKAALKSFYFQRASTELLETHAGVYLRAAGHPDNEVKVHASAATTARPAGFVIPGPKGWYDAGDYNKYIVNSGISTYTLMAAYESFPAYFSAQNLNIPESGDAVPDILNEVMWNLDWMLTMQDTDGGVYHKLTSKNFNGTIMPSADNDERFVVQKATPATLDFAAVMAAASRVYAPFETTFPGKSAAMLAAARSAYAWALANPETFYLQPEDIQTGPYGDGDASDEFAWARAELYVTTKEDAFYTAMNPSNVTADIPYWGGVKSLGWVSLANNIDSLTAIADKELIKSRLDGLAATYAARKTVSAYGVSMETGDYVWGSNGGAANQAFMLLTAYRLDNTKIQYLKSAQALLDYIMGRNATDFSFVTGFGTKTPQKIHHRPSAGDGIAAPIPGFVAGGPHRQNEGQYAEADCGRSRYPLNATVAAKTFLDDYCSYSTNEIAINWNAPLVFVIAGLEVLTP